MKKRLTSLLVVAGLIPATAFARSGSTLPGMTSQGPKQPTPAQISAMQASSSKLLFVENKGQVTDQHERVRKDILFHVDGSRMNVFIGSGKLHYQFTRPLNNPLAGLTDGKLPDEEMLTRYASYRMDVELVGANPNAKVKAEDKQPYFETYYNTADENGAVARAYRKLVFENVYPSVDWVIYSNGTQLEYDFVVKPGGRASDIRIKYNGAKSLKINKDGSLTATTPMGTVIEQAPYSFQQENGKVISSGFVLKNGVLTFSTAPHKGTLVIDPVLSWSSYFGGEGGDYLGTQASNCSDIIAVDNECNLYLSGRTDSKTGIVTAGAYQDTFSSGSSQFLAKFNPDGTIVWSTYYPISMYYPQAATDNDGGVYLSGPALGGSNPARVTPGAYQMLNAGDYDGFIAKFNSDGQREWASFYGGTLRDQPLTIRCDAYNNVYIGGVTQTPNAAIGGSAGLATPNGFIKDTIGKQDGFIAKFSPTGGLLWATYFGGKEFDDVGSIDCDDKGNVYIAGATQSAGLSTIGDGMKGTSDVYLAKFDNAGNNLWIRYFGGEGSESVRSVHCDDFGHVFLGGSTSSTTGIATPGTHQQTKGAAYIAKIDSNGNTIWGTYYLATYGNLYSLASDPLGRIWASGHCQPRAADLPLIVTPGSFKDTVNDLNTEGWMAQFDTSGKRMYGTLFGGDGQEYLLSIATDRSGGVYSAGYTPGGLGLATPGAYRDTLPGGSIDGFFLRFTDCSVIKGTTITADGPTTFCQGESVKLTAVSPGSLGCLSYQWRLNNTNIGGSDNVVYEARVSGDYTLIVSNATGECQDTVAVATTIIANPLPNPVVAKNGNVLTTDSFLTYQWYRNNSAINGETGRSHTATRNGNYKVEVTDSNGCKGMSTGTDITDIVGVSFIAGEQISIYPNPADNFVYVDAPQPVNITITSIDGKLVQQKTNVNSADISNLTNGLYMIRITDKNNNLLLVEKLVKGANK